MSAPSAGDGKPRLVIKRLELENFKSYAGVQHIGPFHKVRRSCLSISLAQHVAWTFRAADCVYTNRLSVQNLSAIMGPNGSGKSNVIDAMLFVFGRRAKQVRLRTQRFTHSHRSCMLTPCSCPCAASSPISVHQRVQCARPALQAACLCASW